VRPVSERFLTSLRGSHRAAFAAYVVAPGQTGTSPTGTEVPILAGDVILDAKASVRSTLTLTTDGVGTFPDQASDLLAPYGNEVFVRRGIGFGGGSVEWVSLGYFRINSAEQDDAPDGPIRVDAQDRMIGIIEARMLAPVQFAATATFGDVVSQLVLEVYPWAVIDWDDATETDPIARTVICEEDRFDFLNDLIRSVGKIWYWDHRGILVIKALPDPEDVVWEVNAGAGGVLVQLSRDLSREGVYNAVVATGEALDTVAPPRGVAVDDNPDSPTYWSGPFGKVPRFYVSPFITTVVQAAAAAASILRQNLGLPYNLDFGQVPNPALEPYDAVAVSARGALRLIRPRTIASESFAATEVDGWGEADTGQTWLMTTPLANFDATAGDGTWSAPAAGDAGFAVLSGVDERDLDGYFVASTPVVAAGAALVFAGILRYTDGNNLLLARIEFDVAGAVAVKISKFTGGAETELAAANPIPGLTYTAGQRWAVHTRAVGQRVQIRVWPDGEVEPTTWHLTVSDTDHTSGSVGFWFWRVGGNTNTGAQFHVDNAVWTTHPGVPAGADVHVIERIRVPLDVTTLQSATTREQTLVVIGEDDA
jgi:uncharacterized protein DUF5047